MAKGDQIYAYRHFLNLESIYEHHGIDCGDGTVIHYRKPSETIEKTDVATFSQGNPIYLRKYIQEFCFIPDAVVERAESRLGEQQYNLLFNNCEHFATWCKTGISDSKQIRDFLPTISKFNIDNLSEPMKQAFENSNSANSQKLLNKALDDIRVVWDPLQLEYKEAMESIITWDQVAREAMKRNREDLARAAIEKKLNSKKKATDLKEQLNQLAKMTENLIKNQSEILSSR